jgi:hypothetical protein
VSIPFTDREMQRAWRDNRSASEQVSRSNSHRLLLFYAVECGLKAILMKRKSINCTNHCAEIADAQHNINKLLDALCVGQSLKLPKRLKMEKIFDKGTKQEREVDAGQINQMWRYSHSLPSDVHCPLVKT